jgi:hypothetical protein
VLPSVLLCQAYGCLGAFVAGFIVHVRLLNGHDFLVSCSML